MTGRGTASLPLPSDARGRSAAKARTEAAAPVEPAGRGGADQGVMPAEAGHRAATVAGAVPSGTWASGRPGTASGGGGAGHTRGRPPSTARQTPVMKVLVIAKSAAWATSWGVPMRRTGLASDSRANSAFFRSSPSASQAPVSMVPGRRR